MPLGDVRLLEKLSMPGRKKAVITVSPASELFPCRPLGLLATSCPLGDASPIVATRPHGRSMLHDPVGDSSGRRLVAVRILAGPSSMVETC